MRAAALLCLIACTRANPAYYPTEGPAPDASAAVVVAPDATAPDSAPPVRDAEPAVPDAAAVTAVVFTEEEVSGAVVPASPGGEGFDDPCGAGRVLIGLVGSAGYPSLSGVDSLQARCADVVLAGKPRGFGTGTATTLAVRGTQGPTRQDGTCPADQVVVGFEATTGQWIDRLYVYCATVSIEVKSNLAAVVIGEAVRLPVALGTPSAGVFEQVRCDAGKVAVGIRGASGYALDWLALRCARPTLR
jgi:hypothetical protein